MTLGSGIADKMSLYSTSKCRKTTESGPESESNDVNNKTNSRYFVIQPVVPYI